LLYQSCHSGDRKNSEALFLPFSNNQLPGQFLQSRALRLNIKLRVITRSRRRWFFRLGAVNAINFYLAEKKALCHILMARSYEIKKLIGCSSALLRPVTRQLRTK
jgi:hypothetical protein